MLALSAYFFRTFSARAYLYFCTQVAVNALASTKVSGSLINLHRKKKNTHPGNHWQPLGKGEKLIRVDVNALSLSRSLSPALSLVLSHALSRSLSPPLSLSLSLSLSVPRALSRSRSLSLSLARSISR